MEEKIQEEKETMRGTRYKEWMWSQENDKYKPKVKMRTLKGKDGAGTPFPRDLEIFEAGSMVQEHPRQDWPPWGHNEDLWDN